MVVSEELNSSVALGTRGAALEPPVAVERGSCTKQTVDLSNHCPIHHLTKPLLEILVRLPCTKSASQCQTVCKRWLNLIHSDPLFLACFIRRRHEIRLPFGFFLQYRDLSSASGKGVLQFSSTDRSAFQSSGFSLKFLPCKDPDRIYVLASYCDLLLCCPDLLDHNVYYLCNPVTKKWLALPLPPCQETAKLEDASGRIRVGFLCEPYYHCSEDENHVIINSEYRFQLVCIPAKIMNHCEVNIFSSETGEWRKFVLQLPPQTNQLTYIINVVAYNSAIHWMDIPGYMDMIGFIPHQHHHHHVGDGNAIRCHIISRPIDPPRGIVGCYGVCKGRWRVCMLQTRRADIALNETPGFSVWELKDYNTGEWTVLRKLYFNKFRAKNSLLSKYASYNGNLAPIDALAFHPFDEDIVYFQFSTYVASCNMRTRRLPVLSKVPGPWRKLQHHGVFPVVLPWWPTPLPRLPA